MTTEEKARAYAEKMIVSKAVPGVIIQMIDDVARTAYLAGATEALASQWVSVEDGLPKPYEDVLTYTIGFIDENAVAYHDGEDWYTINGEHIRPHYWLPIPPLKGGDE